MKRKELSLIIQFYVWSRSVKYTNSCVLLCFFPSPRLLFELTGDLWMRRIKSGRNWSNYWSNHRKSQHLNVGTHLCRATLIMLLQLSNCSPPERSVWLQSKELTQFPSINHSCSLLSPLLPMAHGTSISGESYSSLRDVIPPPSLFCRLVFSWLVKWFNYSSHLLN